MSDCKECENAKAKLKCLICEQTEELKKEKHKVIQFPETISQDDTPYPWLEPQERAIWILYMAKFTEEEIAASLFVTQSTISRYITIIKQKV